MLVRQATEHHIALPTRRPGASKLLSDYETIRVMKIIFIQVSLNSTFTIFTINSQY